MLNKEKQSDYDRKITYTHRLRQRERQRHTHIHTPKNRKNTYIETDKKVRDTATIKYKQPDYDRKIEKK